MQDSFNSSYQKLEKQEPKVKTTDPTVYLIILYFSFSLCLGYLTETISTEGYVYPIKMFLELIILFGLTFAQKNIISNEQFYYRKLIAINFTVWIFGKIGFYSIEVLKGDSKIYNGYALFMLFQVIYHSGEFLFVLTCHLDLLSWDSFLINHSFAYGIAQFACHMEFWSEVYFFHSLKESTIAVVLGGILTAIGHSFRLGAFISAQSNFTHLIQFEKRPTHQLITTGVYKYSRHPSYFGWFLSTAGGQLLLANPICFIGFTAAAWSFFYDRIRVEEYTLEHFFGRAYTDYATKTPIGIPFLQHFINKRRLKDE